MKEQVKCRAMGLKGVLIILNYYPYSSKTLKSHTNLVPHLSKNDIWGKNH